MPSPNGAADLDKRVAERVKQAKAEREKLLNRGADVQLVGPNGEPISGTIRFTSRMLASIEEDYGSLEAYTSAPAEGKVFGHVAYTFRLCFEFGEDEVWDRIDSTQLNEYEKAIGAALVQAMPAPSEEEMRTGAARQLGMESEGNGVGVVSPTPSPGPTSSTRPSSPSASRRRPSGTR
jgi:hypothetical protein